MLIIGHGIDIIDLSRKELENLSFAKRFMTKKEYNIFLEIKEQHKKKIYLASIWSLKEAIIKSINHKYIFSEIEILLEHNRAPLCNLKNIKLMLSLSIEHKYIIASSIAIKEKYEE